MWPAEPKELPTPEIEALGIGSLKSSITLLSIIIIEI
jgi:hypothetical protein